MSRERSLELVREIIDAGKRRDVSRLCELYAEDAGRAGAWGYTDHVLRRVTDARSAGGDDFGEHRSLACLSAEAAAPPPVLLQRILAAVRDFGGRADQSDDITVTVTRFRRAPAGRHAGASM